MRARIRSGYRPGLKRMRTVPVRGVRRGGGGGFLAAQMWGRTRERTDDGKDGRAVSKR